MPPDPADHHYRIYLFKRLGTDDLHFERSSLIVPKFRICLIYHVFYHICENSHRVSKLRNDILLYIFSWAVARRLIWLPSSAITLEFSARQSPPSSLPFVDLQFDFKKIKSIAFPKIFNYSLLISLLNIAVDQFFIVRSTCKLHIKLCFIVTV